MISGRRRVESDLRAAMVTMAARLEQLQDENTRLRLERQRPVSVGSTVERLRETVADPRLGSDAGDDAWAALAEVSVLRDSLLSMVQELSTCSSQLERQLVSLTPAPELDRRAADRRRSPAVASETIDLRGGRTEFVESSSQDPHQPDSRAEVQF